MAESVGAIGLDLVVNQQQFNKQINGIQNLAKKTGRILAGAFTVAAVGKFAKECVDLGSDLAEVQNVVDVTFPKMQEKVNKFAQSAASSFGLSETMAKKFTGTFGAMAKAFGFTEKEAYDMSTVLTGLAGDVASFYNISQDEAFTKLKSVFSGETETLKDLGIVMTQTALDQYALANGFGKTTSAMTEQEKVALRYAFLQQQLSLATGDFARTSGSWANQIRILSLQFDSLKASIGQGLINLFTPIIKVINAVLGKLVTLANAFKSFTAMLMGKKSSGATTSLDTAASSADNVSSSLNNATSSAGNLNKATKKVGDTAKKAAKKISGLMGFDKINKLTETKTSGNKGSSGSGGTGGSGGTSGGSINMGALPSGEEGKALKLGKSFDNLKKSLEKLSKSFSAFSKVVSGAFQWIWKNMLVPLGKWTMQKLAPRLIELLAAALNVLTAVCKALQPLWQWAWDHLFKPLAKFAGDAVIGFLDLLIKGLNGLAKWIGKHQGVVQSITVALISFFTAFKLVTWISKFIGPVKNAISGIKMFAKGIISFKTLFSGLFPKLFASVGKAVGFLTSPIGIAIVVVGALIAAGLLLWKNWDKIKKSKFGKFLSKIAKGFKDLWKWIKKNLNPIKLLKKAWEGIKDKKAKLQAEVKEKVDGALDKLKNGWESIKSKGAELLAEAKEKVEGAVASLKDKWESIKDRGAELIAEAKEKTSGAIDTLKSAWETIKSRSAELVAEAKEKASGMLSKLKDGWESIKDRGAILLTEAKEKAAGALQSLKSKWDNLKDKTATLTGDAKNKAEKVLNTLKSAWGAVYSKSVTLTGYAKNKASSTISALKSAWNTVKKKTAKLTARAVNKNSGTLSKIKSGWNYIKTKSVTLTARFKDFFTAPLKRAWNGIAGAINKGIGVINKIPGVNIPKVPKLAQGGYVKKNTPQLAMIGDNRHQGEVVAPENKMIAMAKKAAELSGGNRDGEIITLLMELINVVKAKETDVYLDSKKITKKVNENNNADIKAGKRPILI